MVVAARGVEPLEVASFTGRAALPVPAATRTLSLKSSRYPHIWGSKWRSAPRYGIIRVIPMQGSELRAARLAAGLSAREIAEAVGVSSRSIERVEADDRHIRPATYQRHLEAARRVLGSRLDALDRLAGASHQ